MNLLEIVMLLIGIAVIIISCILVNRKSTDGGTGDESGMQDSLTIIGEQHKENITAVGEEVISNTEDYLSKLSNEKIMAVSEFSDQILDKIDHNHEEVVFLYNMLNNKEKELKDLAKKLENSEDKTKELLEESEIELETEKPRMVNIQAQAIYNKSANPQPISINNEEILVLAKEGKSIVEISKQLGIGQGEIKLVIDLYKDK